MKALSLGLLLLVLPVASFAAERIEIFSDEALTNNTLLDTEPRIVDLYVAHFDTPATTSCSFRIAASSGFTGVWLSDSSNWTTVGTTQAGFSFTYGTCMVGSNVIVKMAYQLFGTSNCSALSTTNHPIVVPGVIACDRCFSEYPLPFNSLAVNCASPVLPSTWGNVKALYH